MNKNGDLITEYAFDRAYGFCNGYGLVEVDGRKGVVDTNGNIVIEPKYECVFDFDNGTSLVEMNR